MTAIMPDSGATMAADTGGALVEDAEPGPASSDEASAPAAAPHAIGDDRFYHGIIEQVSWSKGNGVVRSGNGREIPFEFSLVTMVGERRSIEHLQPGMRVGFDVGWTSRGLRVTTLKIYG